LAGICRCAQPRALRNFDITRSYEGRQLRTKGKRALKEELLWK